MAQQHNFDTLDAYRKELQCILKRQVNLLKNLEAVNWIKQVKDGGLSPENRKKYVEILNSEAKKLDNFDVVIAVVGTMSAGKSTTINAIVGKEVMPHRDEPMTTLPTLIKHVKGKTFPTLKYHNQAVQKFVNEANQLLLKEPIKDDWLKERYRDVLDFIAKNKFDDEYKGQNNIHHFLKILNDLPRFANDISFSQKEAAGKEFVFPFESCKELSDLPIIEVEFDYLKSVDATQGNLILLDTPGPNEAKQTGMKDVVEGQLARCSAAVFVINATQIGTSDESLLREQILSASKIDKDKLYVFANRIDQTANSFEGIDKIKNHIHHSLFKDDSNKSTADFKKIYAGSARYAYLGSRMSHHASNNDKPNFEEDWVKAFAKFAYGDRKAQHGYEKAELDELIDDAQYLISESHTQDFIKNVIVNSQLNAPVIAMSYAMKDIEKPLTHIHNFLGATGYVNILLAKDKEKLNEIKNLIAQFEKYLDEMQDEKARAASELKKLGERLQEDAKKNFDLIDKTIKEEIDDIFAKKNNDNSSELKKLEVEFKRGFGLFSFLLHDENYKTNKQKAREELGKLRSRYDTDGSEILTLRDESDIRAFQNNLQNSFSNIIANLDDSMNDLLEIQVESLTNAVSEIEKNTETIFKKIKDSLDKSDFDVIFKKPKFDEIKQGRGNHSLNLTSVVEKNQRSYMVEKSGFFGWMGRKTGWGGYEERYTTDYKINIYGVKNLLNKLYEKEVKKPIEKQLKVQLETVGAKAIEDYISQIENAANTIKQDLQNAINFNHELADDLKTNYIAETEQFLSVNTEIEQDMKAVREGLGLSEELV